MLENNPDTGMESGMENLERKNNDLENKNGLGSDNTFHIVVESLAQKGHSIPNDTIFEIKKTPFGNVDNVILKFKGETTLIFYNHGSEMSAIIKGENFRIEGEEKENYHKKYYHYALLFLEEYKNIVAQKSNLGKIKLEKLGI